MNPAALVKVVAHGTVDRIVFLAPAHLRQELGHHKTVGRLLDVLPVGPPAEVIDLLDSLSGHSNSGTFFVIQSHAVRIGDVVDHRTRDRAG